MKSHTKILLPVLCVLVLSACTTSFYYNRLDWLIPWYVDDYIDLSSEQKQSLKVKLEPYLNWHRQEELNNYINLLQRIKGDIATPVDATTVQSWVQEVRLAEQRIKLNFLALALELSDTIDDAQMQEFINNLWKRQQELEQEYLLRTDLEYTEDSYERLLKYVSRFMGKLSDAQDKRLYQAASELQRLDRAWLADREAWLDKMMPYLKREPGWQQEIKLVFTEREEYRTAAYQTTVVHNLESVSRAIADVMNQRNDSQDKKLNRKLDELIKDLEQLNRQLQAPTEAPRLL